MEPPQDYERAPETAKASARPELFPFTFLGKSFEVDGADLVDSPTQILVSVNYL